MNGGLRQSQESPALPMPRVRRAILQLMFAVRVDRILASF